MGGGAADHGAQGHDAVILAAGGQLLADQGHLERTGDAHDGDVLGIEAVAFQIVQGAAGQAVHDEIVETGGQDGDLEAFGIKHAADGSGIAHGLLLKKTVLQ